MTEYIFINGTGRCGSTLIHEIVARHEASGFISNVEDRFPFLAELGRLNSRVFRSPLGRRTRKGGVRFAPSEAYRIIANQVSPVYAYSHRNLSADDATPWLQRAFRDFFENRARIQNKPIFLHKYTGWSRMRFFDRIFPEARFVHVVRDGRAVANSWLKMPWWNGYRGPTGWLWGELPDPYRVEWERSGRSFVTLAGIGWKYLLDGFEEDRNHLSEDRYLLLRYEDFLDDPRGVMSQLLAFCGLPWTNKFDKQFSRIRLNDGNRAYRHDLSPRQLKELETSLGERLNQYGYP